MARHHGDSSDPTPGSFGGERDGAPDPVQADRQVDRFAAVAHELNNLLDGSIRCLALARRTLGAQLVHAAGSDVEQALRQMETAGAALERMAELVHASMQNSSVPLGSPLLAGAGPVSLRAALEHAAAVVRPFADEHRVQVRTEIDASAESTPASALYLVALNGLRNAVEACAECGGGAVLVMARVVGDPGRVIVEIIDDGKGPPADRGRPFQPGYSTKGAGRGNGLAIAQSLVASMRGTIELRRGTRSAPEARPGAVLRIECPAVRLGAIGSEETRRDVP